MKTQKYSVQLYATFIAVIILMSLTPVFADQGSIWTTNEDGTKQDGNVYTNPLNVHLAVNLAEGDYYFQVTDTQGKVLSDDENGVEDRRFTVQQDGEIVPKGPPHPVDEKYRVVQLWPFDVIEGTCKIWVTSVEDYDIYGDFLPAYSKTDNFKVTSVPKYFDLWVTKEMRDTIEGRHDLQGEFFVDYAIDNDGDPNTVDPVNWIVEEPLVEDRLETIDIEGAEYTFYVYRHQAFFPIGTYIYWSFSAIHEGLQDGLQWTSDVHGPEEISEAVIVNLERIFLIDGFLYNSNGEVREGVIVKLYKDNPDDITIRPPLPTAVPIAVTETDVNGYFAFIAVIPDSTVAYTVFSEATNDNPEVWYWFYCPTEGVTGHTFEFNEYDVPEIRLRLKGQEVVDKLEVVFTPAGEDLYKVSSTNMGSFFLYVVNYGDPGSSVKMTILLSEDGANTPEEPCFDTPNFLLHHDNKGLADVHVYKGTYESKKGDITNDFDIYTDPEEYSNDHDGADVPYLPKDKDKYYVGKWVRVEGYIPPDAESVCVRVHLNFDLEPLTWEQVLEFYDYFEYWFTVIYNPRGVRIRGVR